MKKSLIYLAAMALVLLAGCKKEEADNGNVATPDLSQGLLPGLFAVDNDTKVQFSQGNLQYNAAADRWRFAEEQYEIVGQANEAVAAGYDGWIDLFGWGTSGYHNPDDVHNTRFLPWDTAQAVASESYNYYGYGPSVDRDDTNLVLSAASYDWGVHNGISNGGGRPGMWRVLSKEEWEYLLNSRSASTVDGQEDVRYCMALVGGQLGLMLFPDSYLHPLGVPTPQDCNEWMIQEVANRYSAEQWRQMEEAGVVFLPCGGHRYGGEVIHAGTYGSYWGSSCANPQNAWFVAFKDQGVYTSHSIDRCFGHSVRLVREKK